MKTFNLTSTGISSPHRISSLNHRRDCFLPTILATIVGCSHCYQENTFFQMSSGDNPEKEIITRKVAHSNEIQANQNLFHRWFTFRGALAIKLHRLEAPESVQEGQTFALKCIPDVKKDRMQSLSWYKNGREFYRYQPYDRSQSVLIFNLSGINVDRARSRNHTVVLTNITSETEGRYKCEVTGHSFQEDRLETYIKVLSATSRNFSTQSYPIKVNITLLFLTITIITLVQLNWRTYTLIDR